MDNRNMACIDILPDDPPSDVRCGSVINGQTVVVVQEELKNRRILMAVGCRGQGQSPRCRHHFYHDTERQVVFSGDLAPGTHRFPFSLNVPDACSWKGTILNFNWYLCARMLKADKTLSAYQGAHQKIYGGFEHEKEIEISLSAPAVSASDRDNQSRSRFVRKDSPLGPGCIITSVVIFVSGLAIVWWGMPIHFSLPGILAAAVGLVFLYIAARQKRTFRNLSPPEWYIEYPTTWPGDRIRTGITFQTLSPVRIKKAVIVLKAWEQVKYHTGRGRTTGPMNKHMIHEIEKPLDVPDRPLPAGTPLTIEGEIEIPADAPCTMDFDNEVKILWGLEFRLEPMDCPSWFDVEPVVVLPRITVPST